MTKYQWYHSTLHMYMYSSSNGTVPLSQTGSQRQSLLQGMGQERTS